MKKLIFLFASPVIFFGGLSFSSGEPPAFLYVDKNPVIKNDILSTEIVDFQGALIRFPIIIFSPLTTSFHEQISTAVLGTSSQRIVVKNNTKNQRWTLTLSASKGSSALWKDEGKIYDWNDESGKDGNDQDIVGGKLSVDPTEMHILAKEGCSAKGISPGIPASFSEKKGVENITIAVAGNTANSNCEWSFTNIRLSQVIPAEQSAGNYTLDMTLTITAF
ncbi:hypothetical protein IPN35_02490 [Candidatus Peregrinibacteria bacterium]|nr:MAG: hypothetical protein IPN35_02490 [Candidatus Peregrinibacteria bacterium]